MPNLEKPAPTFSNYLCHTEGFDERVDLAVEKKWSEDFKIPNKISSSPLAMKSLFGYNSKVYAKNLTTDDSNKILITSGNLLSIYDYEYDTHNILQVHRNKILSTSVDMDGNYFVTADMGEESSIIIWDALRSLPVHIIKNFNGNGCPFVKLSPCAKYLLTVAEKQSSKDIKLISLWEWKYRRDHPDVTVEVDSSVYGYLKKVDFCFDNCSYLILTTEKQVLFLTYADEIYSEYYEKVIIKFREGIKLYSNLKEKTNSIKRQICTKRPSVKTTGLVKKNSKSTNPLNKYSKENKKKILIHAPQDIHKIKNRGIYMDSVYVCGTRMAISGTSTGNIVVWSDIGLAEHYHDTSPPFSELSNKKNFLLQLCLDPYPVQTIYNIDCYVVTINSKGQIAFYNNKLIPVFKIEDLGTNAPENISFNLRQRSKRFKLSPEEFSEAKERLVLVKHSVGPEKKIIERKMFKNERNHKKVRKNKENLNAFVFDAVKNTKRRKVEKWKQVQDLVSCLHNRNEIFDVRDFIITTNQGDIMYVNITHEDVYEVLRNYYHDLSSMDNHPLQDYLCVATTYGKLFLLDYNTHIVIKERQLDLEAVYRDDNIDSNDPQLKEKALNITFIKYSPDVRRNTKKEESDHPTKSTTINKSSFQIRQITLVNKISFTKTLNSNSGHWIACGTQYGDVWLFNGFSLHIEMRLRAAKLPISKLEFSKDGDFFAFYDTASHLILYKTVEAKSKRSLKFICRLRTHFKKMTDVTFLKTNQETNVYSIAEDGYLIQCSTDDCEEGSNRMRQSIIVDEFAIPTCLKPVKNPGDVLMVFNNENKCKIIDTKIMAPICTVQGPSCGGVALARLLKIEASSEKFLLFAAESVVGLMKLPIDGNPFKIASSFPGVQKVASVCAGRGGKVGFSLTYGEHITVWDINIMVLNKFEKMGGSGFTPYAVALQADPNSMPISDMEILFKVAVLSAAGITTTKPRILDETLPVLAVPNFIRSLGFFPSVNETKTMVNELLAGDDILQSKKKISFEECLKIFYNYRTKRFSDNLTEKLFESICKGSASQLIIENLEISSRKFAILLHENGEKFTTCQFTNFMRALVKPLSKEEERKIMERNVTLEDTPENLVDTNSLFDFMPKRIAYNYFKEVILGMDEWGSIMCSSRCSDSSVPAYSINRDSFQGNNSSEKVPEDNKGTLLKPFKKQGNNQKRLLFKQDM